MSSSQHLTPKHFIPPPPRSPVSIRLSFLIFLPWTPRTINLTFVSVRVAILGIVFTWKHEMCDLWCLSSPIGRKFSRFIHVGGRTSILLFLFWVTDVHRVLCFIYESLVAGYWWSLLRDYCDLCGYKCSCSSLLWAPISYSLGHWNEIAGSYDNSR